MCVPRYPNSVAMSPDGWAAILIQRGGTGSDANLMGSSCCKGSLDHKEVKKSENHGL